MKIQRDRRTVLHFDRVSLRDFRQRVTYIIDPDHDQYCGDLPLEEQAHIITHAVGGRGPNTEYLFNSAGHLADLGIVDEELSWLSRRVREIQSAVSETKATD